MAYKLQRRKYYPALTGYQTTIPRLSNCILVMILTEISIYCVLIVRVDVMHQLHLLQL